MELKLIHTDDCATGYHYDEPSPCDCGAEAQAKLTCQQIVEMFNECWRTDKYDIRYWDINALVDTIEQLREMAK